MCDYCMSETDLGEECVIGVWGVCDWCLRCVWRVCVCGGVCVGTVWCEIRDSLCEHHNVVNFNARHGAESTVRTRTHFSSGVFV